MRRAPVSAAPDAAARREALDPARSFIVKAPAGSGKTSLLVARFLTLLAGAGRPEEVLAITFTRKAAAEMLARVVDALAAAAGPVPDEPHAASLHALAVAAAARDREQGWKLSENPQRLSIQTIDALCGALARRLPVLSGLGGGIATQEEPQALYRQAARRTLALLDDAAHAPAVLSVLDHLDGNMAAFEELLASMLARRDRWLRHLRVDDPGAWRAELEDGLRALVEAALAAAAAAVPPDRAAELARLAAFAGERAAAVDPGDPLTALCGLQALPPARGDALAAWKALAALLLTAAGDVRKRPPGPAFKASETRDEYDAMRALLEDLAGDDALPAALAAVRALPAPAYDDGQWQVLLDLLQVLRLAVASLRLEFAAAGASDFAEHVAAAAQALGEEQAPTDLALALDYRIRHLLVDEFQDTSVAHFEIVTRLTAGWSPGDGHTLFLVGDPMQSIYRFREAEVGLFLGCWRDGLDTVDLEPLSLSANFRSRAGIVEWVNAGFPVALPRRDDPLRGAAAYEPAAATRAAEPGDAVSVHAGVERDAPAEAALIARTVAAARAEDPGQSIAILLRSRAQAPPILDALHAADLRWRGVDLQPLFAVPAVRDLHALAAALLHPLDRVSWLAVLRAPWCGLSLDDLEALAGDDAGAPLDRLADPARLRALSADGASRVARVAPLLAEAAARVGRDRLARLVARTWAALGGPACLGDARLEDARRYLRLLASLEAESAAPDPDELARRARALHAAPAPGAVDVEIMTIHKAKGLEFDVVLLPGLARGARGEDRDLLAWTETATRDGSRLLIAPLPPPEGEGDSPLHAFVRGIEQDKRRLETARLLYVACTRARRRLHLFASVSAGADGEPPRAPPADSLLAPLWPVLAARFADAPREDDAGGVAAAAEPAIRRLPLDWQPPAPPPPVAATTGLAPPASAGEGVEFSWAGPTARHVGTVAHAALRVISADGPDAWDDARLAAARAAWRGALAARGVPSDELDGALDAVADVIAHTLADRRGRWLLDAGHDDARSEYAVSGLVDGALVHAVVDRTFVDRDGVRWIVDYKTGRHGGGGVDEFLDREQQRYRAQLEGYAVLLHALDPRPVRVALYYPAMAGWRAWAWAWRGAG